jgi:hypothetical protein
MLGVRNHGVKRELFMGGLIGCGDSFKATIGIIGRVL